MRIGFTFSSVILVLSPSIIVIIIITIIIVVTWLHKISTPGTAPAMAPLHKPSFILRNEIFIKDRISGNFMEECFSTKMKIQTWKKHKNIVARFI